MAQFVSIIGSRQWQRRMGRLLITGCGRSGTRYIKDALALAGVDVGHEAQGPVGIVDWHKAIDVSGYEIILHQVRNPLRVVESCHTITSESWGFIYEHENRIKRSDSLLVSCMKYWLYWNELAENVSSVTYRVEDTNAIAMICRQIGVKPKNGGEISTQNHTRRGETEYPSLTWGKLEDVDSAITAEMMVAARRYKYEIGD